MFANADANEDGTINVNDITATAKIILGSGLPVLQCPDDNNALHLFFFSGYWGWFDYYYRYNGLSVRAVCP